MHTDVRHRQEQVEKRANQKILHIQIFLGTLLKHNKNFRDQEDHDLKKLFFGYVDALNATSRKNQLCSSTLYGYLQHVISFLKFWDM